MAHVSLPSGDGDRGQLLVVASLALALLFVVLALYLNTAIYTENLATRKSDIAGASGATQYQAAATDGVAGTMTYANYHNNSSYADLDESFSTAVGNWSDFVGRHEAVSSRSANVSLVSTTNGTRIVQQPDHNFTNVSDAADWTLAEDATVRQFRMNVTRTSLTSSTLGNVLADVVFHVRFDDGTEVWEVYVYQDGGSEIRVGVVDATTGTEYGPCRVSQSRAVVDVTGATVGGQECEPLTYLDNLSAPYDVGYNDTTDAAVGDTVVGEYELFVDRHRTTVDSALGHHYGPEGSSSDPYLTRAIYAAEVEVDYETERIDYGTRVRVAPGEIDD